MLFYLWQANNLLAETAMKQVAQYTKVVSHVFDMISKARDEWEVESTSRSGMLTYFILKADISDFFTT